MSKNAKIVISVALVAVLLFIMAAIHDFKKADTTTTTTSTTQTETETQSEPVAKTEAYVADYEPGDYDQQDAIYYTRKEGGTYQIIVSDCALRSEPSTRNGKYTKYGVFKDTSHIFTDVVYEDTTNKWYGVPSDTIAVQYLKERAGNPINDPDGIV